MITMPHTIMGYVLAFTGIHQTGLAVLSVAVFGLSAVRSSCSGALSTA